MSAARHRDAGLDGHTRWVPLALDLRIAERRGERHVTPSIRVLVVGDEGGPRATAVEVLREEGYEVLEARDAEGAVALCRTRSCHVVLAAEPAGDRDDLLAAIAGVAPATRVVVVRQRPDLQSYVAAAEQGAAEILFTPLRADELRGAVRKAAGLDPPRAA
jgi:DNA-binding NtrC family response regulator